MAHRDEPPSSQRRRPQFASGDPITVVRPSHGSDPASPPCADDDESALDVLATVVRALAVTADEDESETASTREECEAWARHVLLATPAPHMTEATTTARAGRRDWRGLVGFVRDLRKRQSDKASGSVKTLRQTVWDFVSKLQSMVADEDQSDDAVRTQLQALAESAQTDSIDKLRQRATHVIASVSSAIEQRKKSQQARLAALGQQLRTMTIELDQARKAGSIDPLTKLFNRRAFDEYVARVVALDGLVGRSTAMMMVDVDHFKKVNDTYGHPTGDEVLKRLADQLARTFPRKSDFVARYGGEEFVLVLRDTTIADARMLADRLLGAARKIAVDRPEGQIKFTVSVGVAELAQGETVPQWVERADKALYEAKKGGRDRFVASD